MPSALLLIYDSSHCFAFGEHNLTLILDGAYIQV